MLRGKLHGLAEQRDLIGRLLREATGCTVTDLGTDLVGQCVELVYETTDGRRIEIQLRNLLPSRGRASCFT